MAPTNPHMVFCFAGQGYVPQESARDLYRTSPIFRAAITEIDTAVTTIHREDHKRRVQTTMTDYLSAAEARPPASRTDTELDGVALTTPDERMIIFAAQYALARTIQARGIQPASVVGYSLGEHIAAMVTGSLPLEAGMRLFAKSQELMAQGVITSEGGMVTVQAEPGRTLRALAQAGASGDVEVSGYPHPRSTVLSGEAGALDKAQMLLGEQGIETQRRDIKVGMHSSHVGGLSKAVREDPDFLPETSRVVGGVDHWSCLGFQLSEGTPLNMKHWATVTRTPIQYRQCVEGIFNKSVQSSSRRAIVFLDLGMGPRLSRLTENTLKHTPEWQRGQVQAISCVQPMALDEKTKARSGWAMKQLESSLDEIMQREQARL